jgi:hypothetical protein
MWQICLTRSEQSSPRLIHRESGRSELSTTGSIFFHPYGVEAWQTDPHLLHHYLQEEGVTTPRPEAHIHIDHFSFGTIRIDGWMCGHDVVIDRGEVRKWKKGPSQQFCDASATPLSIEE